MLSAKDFYKLQKRGELAKAPESAVIVNSIKKNLDSITQSVKDATSFLHPELRKQNDLSMSHSTSVSTRKRRRKKKRKKEARSTDLNDNIPQKDIGEARQDGLSKKSRRHRRRKETLKPDGELNFDSLKPRSDPSVKPTCGVPVNNKPTAANECTNVPKHLGMQNNLSQSKVNTFACPLATPANVKCIQEDGDDEYGYSQIDWDDLMDIQKRVDEAFTSLLTPVSPETFFESYFESNPLRIEKAKNPFMEYISSEVIDDILRQQRVMFTEHLDLAVYRNGRRETLNPPGRAFRSVVWDHYNMGCSIRFLSPQLFIPELAACLGLLQEYFGCFVGANLYLTPPGSQGFAPHYDDVEVFIVQLEGSKNWRIYNPRNSSEELPRFSSPNFLPEDIGEPTMKFTLKPGNLLYLPRGYIHQATTSGDKHSLHLTISTYQRHTWGDLLDKLLPTALRSAMETDLDFRRGLPLRFLRHVGGFSAARHLKIAGSEEGANEARVCEQNLRSGVVKLLRRLADKIEEGGDPKKEEEHPSSIRGVDALLVASDLMAVDLIHQSLPPKLDEVEAVCHVTCQGDVWSDDDQAGSRDNPAVSVKTVAELEPDTMVRLVRWSAVRAVRTRLGGGTMASPSLGAVDCGESSEEEGGGDSDENSASSGDSNGQDDRFLAVYHSLSNTDVYKERPLEEMALTMQHLPALDFLVKAFPTFVPIDSLPLTSIEEKMNAAIGLYEAGFLVTREPLENDSESDEDIDAIEDSFGASGTESSDLGDVPTTDGDETESTGDENEFVLSGSSEDSASSDSITVDEIVQLTGSRKRAICEQPKSCSVKAVSLGKSIHLSADNSKGGNQRKRRRK